jgi:hypothetical protein
MSRLALIAAFCITLTAGAGGTQLTNVKAGGPAGTQVTAERQANSVKAAPEPVAPAFTLSYTRAQSGPCDGRASDLKPSYGTVIIDRRVHQLLRCAGQRFGVSVPRLICTADRESSFWPWADSGSSKGVMQQNATYWPGRVQAFWVRSWMPRHYPPSIFSARANIIVSARMIAATGWGDWSGGCV